MRVLVSGVAGDIGFGIGRILRDWGVFSELHGTDIHSDHPGEIIYDKCNVAPRANDLSYLKWLKNYITENQIQVVIPSSEAEISVLKSQKDKMLAGANLLINDTWTIENSLDKHACLSYLKSCGIPVPEHGIVGTDSPSSYPVIVKPRQGQGSKGIRLVSCRNDLDFCPRGYVWQQKLFPDDQEYTCALYASKNTPLRVLLMRRSLHGGLTSSGVVVSEPNIENYVRSIADFMHLNGSINIQLRMTHSGPLLFEINPRLSSTLVFRDKLGFSDLRWWLAEVVKSSELASVLEYSEPFVGVRFYRGSQEYIL